MRQTTGTRKRPGEKIVKDFKWATRKHYSSKEKIRIVLDGLRGEDSIAELYCRESISKGIYYKWSKDFIGAGRGGGDRQRLRSNSRCHPRPQAIAKACMTAITTNPGQKRLDSCVLALPKLAKPQKKLGIRARGALKTNDLLADTTVRVENGQSPHNTKLLGKYRVKNLIWLEP